MDALILGVTNPTSFSRRTVMFLKTAMLIAINCSLHRLAKCG